MNDKIGATDWLEGRLAEASDAVRPCPECGKESKEHHPKMDGDVEVPQRICAMPTCRFSGHGALFRKYRTLAN